AVPAPALRLQAEPRAPRPPFLLLAAAPARAPAHRGASAGRPPLPAGHERRRRGAARNLRQLLPLAGRAPHRPEAAAAATRSRALRSAEEKATQRSRSRGPTASEPVRPPPTPPARPGRRAAHSGPAAGAPGLGGGCSRAARARRGHLPGSHPASAGVWPQRQRRRNARPSGRGGTGGVTTLKGSAPLVKAPPGHSEMFLLIYLTERDIAKQEDWEMEKQAPAGQAAQCQTQSQDPGIMA
uniref:Uncharacterized protein n=1 Tax=Mustela putorius furo TaxID=9669 RepID=M3XSS1_MUSPF